MTAVSYLAHRSEYRDAISVATKGRQLSYKKIYLQI